jgi:hypothetical protein
MDRQSMSAVRSSRRSRSLPFLPSRSIRAIAIVALICFSLIGGVLQPSWPAIVRNSLGQQDAGQIFKSVQAADYQYKTTVKADSPSAYWPQDDGSGTAAADASGNGHSLSFNYTLHW